MGIRDNVDITVTVPSVKPIEVSLAQTPQFRNDRERMSCVCVTQEKQKLKEEIRGTRCEFRCKENRGPQV